MCHELHLIIIIIIIDNYNLDAMNAIISVVIIINIEFWGRSKTSNSNILFIVYNNSWIKKKKNDAQK